MSFLIKIRLPIISVGIGDTVFLPLNIGVIRGKKKRIADSKLQARARRRMDKRKTIRAHRVEVVAYVAERMLDEVRPGARFIKKDIRSTKYDVTRLKDLLAMYRRRLIRITHGELDREIVAAEVHGHMRKLYALLRWAKKEKYKSLIFVGDYFGKKNHGLEALDELRNHMDSRRSPKIVPLMGFGELKFLRAMLGDDSDYRGEPFTSAWPYAKGTEGPGVMNTLKRISERKIGLDTPVRLKEETREAKEFEKTLSDIAKKNGTSFEEEWKRWYRFHPKLIDTMKFMINNMNFV